jgi:hypothetical protein
MSGYQLEYGTHLHQTPGDRQMTPMVTLVLIIAVALAAYLVQREIRRRRTPPELRGDWWKSFEREFGAYVSRTSSSSQQSQRRGKKHGSAGR